MFSSRKPYDPQHPEHHRDISGGTIRAAVFGVSDGLVSNASLILGVAGADPDAGIVRLAGLAGLIAGAFSMAAGEYVSMAAQKELLEYELDVERRSIAENPEGERRELKELFKSRGVPEYAAELLSHDLMKDEDQALEVHAREELGVDPASLGSPYGAAASSFVAFGIGGTIPLIPWFFTEGMAAVIGSVILAAITALVVGALVGVSASTGPWRGALRQLAIAMAAAGITYAVGALLGVQVS